MSESRPSVTTQSMDLRAWARALLIVGGGALAVVGALAVFKTQNQAGSVALIVAGVVPCVLGLLGRWPVKGTIGTFQWDFSAAVDQLLDDAQPPEVQRAAASAILTTATTTTERAPDGSGLVARAATVMEGSAWEADAVEALRRIQPLLDADLTPKTDYMCDATFDNGEHKVGVVLKWSLDASSVERIRGEWTFFVPSESLLFVCSRLTAAAQAKIAHSGPGDRHIRTQAVTWNGPQDDKELEDMLRHLLTTGSSSARPLL